MKTHSIGMRNRLYALVFLSVLVGLAGTVMEGTVNQAAAALTEADCRVCHAVERISKGVPVVDMVGPHHDLQRANNWNCSYCHNTPETDKVKPLDCLLCHSGSGHTSVHDFVGPPSNSCTSCHDANVVTEHVDNRNLSCSVCHDNPAYAQVITDGRNGINVTCYDCHTANDHHATTQAQSGNCTYCHADPRLALDPNAPTGQLACRQCHGTNQHGNGGPIQDYGACFACHQPAPYHAKPAGWPGWYEEVAAAPGRGSFNLFYNEFRPSCASDKCEDSMKHRSGYGEKSQPESRRGSDWRNPSVSFTMVPIFDYFTTNQAWSVPTFGSAGGGGADTVTVTYAGYYGPNNRLKVFAETSLGENATMTVSYGGSNYDMSWNSLDGHWERVITTSSCSNASIDVSSSGGGTATGTIRHCQ